MQDLCEHIYDAAFEAEATGKGSYAKLLEGFSQYREAELVCSKANLRVDANISNVTFGKLKRCVFSPTNSFSIEEHDGIRYRMASEPPLYVETELWTKV
jgi:hypothetical protein